MLSMALGITGANSDFWRAVFSSARPRRPELGCMVPLGGRSECFIKNIPLTPV